MFLSSHKKQSVRTMISLGAVFWFPPWAGFHTTNTCVGQVSIPADDEWFTQRLGG